MANITRKFTEYKATMYYIENEGGEPKLVAGDSVKYLATTPDERTARREIKNAGYDIKPSTVITVEAGPVHKYTCTIDAFLDIATDEIVADAETE